VSAFLFIDHFAALVGIARLGRRRGDVVVDASGLAAVFHVKPFGFAAGYRHLR
jgi:hypothetical protein